MTIDTAMSVAFSGIDRVTLTGIVTEPHVRKLAPEAAADAIASAIAPTVAAAANVLPMPLTAGAITSDGSLRVAVAALVLAEA